MEDDFNSRESACDSDWCGSYVFSTKVSSGISLFKSWRNIRSSRISSAVDLNIIRTGKKEKKISKKEHNDEEVQIACIQKKNDAISWYLTFTWAVERKIARRRDWMFAPYLELSFDSYTSSFNKIIK